ATIEQKSLVKNPEIKLIPNHLKKIVLQHELEYYIEVISVIHICCSLSQCQMGSSQAVSGR
ncbi:hypothetical protein, partial [Lacticaseibacillus paracasei]|uniref:hypothetical protein n=1 Tax=Lacticaseibacillus paracasei TaxID=1597 RepID=UPI0022E01D55